jgi:tRNA dimethylallyltransferase
MGEATESGPLLRAIALVGPTAAGKSALGLEVAERLGCAITCCDSVQVYRGLDIGSAKPSLADQRRVPHRCLDLVKPDQHFSAGDYARAVETSRGEAPDFFVGGTGFYLRAAAWTLSGEARDAPLDDPVRARFEAEWTAAERATPGTTHRALAARDPETAAQIHPRNFVRTLRALWLCERCGVPVSSVRKHDPPRPKLDLLAVVLDPGQPSLDEAIARRCDKMLAEGFVREVEKLVQAGYDGRFRAMRSLGYKQVLEHVAGNATLSQTREEIIRTTRQYARRQRTFFRNQLDPDRTMTIANPNEFPWPQVEQFWKGAG